MSGRFRSDAKHIFDVFVEVVGPNEEGADPWILQTFPHTVSRDSLKSVPQFVYPCELEIHTVQNFSFVLTKDDAKWTFGFCRQSPDAETSLVILSSLPWHDTFYKVLNYAAELMHRAEANDLFEFLAAVHEAPIPKPETTFLVSWGVAPGQKDFTCKIPDHLDLPSIPENRNLTEYYNAVGIHSMLVVFASMLYERRVIIVSRKLSRLSACVQAANSIIYPMQWQHIYIPILSKQLMDYLSAPMPFLIGVPTPIFERARMNEIGDAVILNADENQIRTPFADLESLPVDVSNNLKKSLKSHKDLLGDSVARAFLHALVHLIGGYRDALKCRPNENITFDEDSFIHSRSPTLQPFLEQMLQLQIFQQFIEERLNLLNSGKGISDEFEKEAVCFTEKPGGSNRKLKAQYSVLSSSMKKEGGALVKAVKNKANPAMKQAVQSVRDGSKTAYKEIRSRIREGPTQGSRHQVRRKELHRTNSCSSAPSSPTLKRNNRSLSITSVGSGNSSSSTAGLPSLTRNNTDLNLLSGRILKYERFDPPSISTFENEKSPEMEGPPPLDLDLMTDLQDVIFKKKEDVPPPVNRQLKPLLRRAPPAKVLADSTNSNAEFEVARFENNLVFRKQNNTPCSRSSSSLSTTTQMTTNNHNTLSRVVSTSRTNNPFYNNGNVLMPIAPPRVRRNVSSLPIVDHYEKSNPSLGDLINLASTEASPESPSDVIFDPLFQSDKKSFSNKNPVLQSTAPPSSHTNPFVVKQNSNNKELPSSKINGIEQPLSGSLHPPPKNPPLVMQKSTTSSSSDDLLQEYGIDFNKLRVNRTQSVFQPPKGNGGINLLTDLDPLAAATASGTANTVAPPMSSMSNSWLNHRQQPSIGGPPVAPPRTSYRKPNWTTFD
ncbi:DENN domain-containing protein 1B isoform X1 [Lepeophtheirus salmonis]|uniref:DENN domain-containing protein 1B isoform X1 n=1 Tax=Lepeophtheirus salmonis TaxID=72036 RepID=UPI001AEB16B4|nr:DENN domain-containing protein 1B-like isoform X1 [Lepeophtheirus salmonis]